MQFQFLTSSHADALWGTGSGNPLVPMAPIRQARLLWLNARAAPLDPAWQAVNGNLEAYGEHILATCAKLIVASDKDACRSGADQGYADRYGGAGIGRNGGSGRAAVLDGYHIKGVGRTPLVSEHTSPEHASGGAYLEECIREVIHSEIVATEFPFGAVPVLAVIDTGLVQTWATGGAPKRERRCLLVRPAFVRPAHLERAAGYLGSDPRAGSQDACRVRHAFGWMRQAGDRYAMADTLTRFACRWAAQLAYGFVHRLSHGGHSTSNICLDGGLVDFGASTALPSWAKTRVIPGGQVFGHEFAALTQALTPATYYWARFGDTRISTPQFQQNLLSQAAQEYNQTILVEVLRVLGLARQHIPALLGSSAFPEIAREIGVLIRYFQQDRLDILESTPSPARPWDLARFWSDSPPPYARGLRKLLDEWAGQGLCRDAIHVARRRCRLLQSTRHSLFREESKRAIFDVLEGELAAPPTRESVTAFVQHQVAVARRDSVHEFGDAVPTGFAIADHAHYALFTGIDDGSMFAVVADRSRQAGTVVERIPARACGPDEVWLGDSSSPVIAAFHNGSATAEESLRS
ncbi:hypothetical protein [Massilia sp. DD77]|uniref:hypothetical protein n=1 Tax=Massilia sp. DD77 TaxID=3109349 RepID=UPI002FFF76B7